MPMYITFQKHPISCVLLTEIYDVASVSNGTVLGLIKWHPQWRQYCFFPEEMTFWSAGCLQDVQDFIGKLMAERGR